MPPVCFASDGVGLGLRHNVFGVPVEGVNAVEFTPTSIELGIKSEQLGVTT